MSRATLTELRARLRELEPPAERFAPTQTGLEGLLGVRGLVQLGGNGKSTIALSRSVAALRAGGAAAWIAPDEAFLPLGALEAGGLERLLFVRVTDGPAVLRAADLLLSCAGAVEVATLALPERFRPSSQRLLRLQRQAERSDTTLLLLDQDAPDAPSFGPAVFARIHARRPPSPDWKLSLTVVQHKRGPCGPLPESLPHPPKRLRPHSSY